jgi:type II restriction enzyme
MDLLHITKPEDLVTSYNETRAGFIAIALEKNRRAAPYIEEARVLQYRMSAIESPEELLDTHDIRNGLIAAAGYPFQNAALPLHLNSFGGESLRTKSLPTR